MDELERMLLIGNLIWFGSLAAPVIVGIAAALAARRPTADRVRVRLIGVIAAFAFGTVGSYLAGETILEALGSVGDIPWHRFLQAWHRMWYPLGISVLVGITLTVFALYPKQSAA